MSIMFIPFNRVHFKLGDSTHVHRKTIEYIRKQGLIEPIVVKKSKAYDNCWVVHPHHVELAQAFIQVAKETLHGTNTLMCVDWAIMPDEDRKGI